MPSGQGMINNNLTNKIDPKKYFMQSSRQVNSKNSRYKEKKISSDEEDMVKIRNLNNENESFVETNKNAK